MNENDFYILNRETGKLELHFDKSSYTALTDEQKADIKSAFLWGRNSGCWISRAKVPNLYAARRCAERIGLADAGETGERLSFAEQMERTQARAERRRETRRGAASPHREDARRYRLFHSAEHKHQRGPGLHPPPGKDVCSLGKRL